MNSPRFQLLNWFLLVLVMLIVCGFQTTFWYQIVGSVPAPLLWLNVVLYIILYRRGFEAVILNYVLGLVMLPFTAMHLGRVWTLLLCLAVSINFAKKRIFWPGTRYFIIASLCATFACQIFYFIISRVTEGNAVDFNFYTHILELLFTPLWAAPIYWLMSFVDRISEKEPLPERGVIA